MNWEKAKIVEICRGIYDGPHATPPASEDGAIFLGISNITPDGHLDLSDPKYISENDFPKWTKRVTPQAGDIVFSYEATLNLYAMIPKGFRGCLGRRMALIRPDEEKVLGRYLYYYFFSDEWRATIAENTVIGATVDRIPLIRFPEFPVSFPSLEKQKAIADTLSAYDDLIENNQKQIKLLEEAAQRLYKEWFVDLRFPGHETTPITDGIPEGWKKYKFSEIASIMSGGTPKTEVKEYYDGDIPFYTPKDSDGAFFAFDTITHISQSGLDHCNSQYYPVGTVIITARGTVGKTTILAVPMAMNQSCYALKCDELNSPYYLFFSLNKEVAALKTMANGGVFNTIIVKTFDSIHLTVPTRDVLAAFDAAASPIMEQIKAKMQQNTHLVAARDRLLPKLMNGEIEVYYNGA